MSIDFHAQENRYTYATRRADSSWMTLVNSIVAVNGKRALEIGLAEASIQKPSPTWAQLLLPAWTIPGKCCRLHAKTVVDTPISISYWAALSVLACWPNAMILYCKEP